LDIQRIYIWSYFYSGFSALIAVNSGL